ncbi:MAG: TIGR03862 family flavoprotein, partial [Beijerinckiaceae bacterium]
MSGKRVIVAGAGPAGLMAADILSARGHAVTIYDAMPSPARKFLLAGRGGLNLTHSEAPDIFLIRYPLMTPQLRAALQVFDAQALRSWADALGEPTFTGSSGRVFPKSFKASPLLRAWLRRLADRGVTLNLRHRLMDIAADGVLVFETGMHERIQVKADAGLLALGGASWPRLGSTGAWTDILARHGVALSPLRASNMGFNARWSAPFSERHAGQPIKNAMFHFGARSVAGEAIITRSGMEGGAIYALSADLRDAIARDGTAHIIIDLKPGVAADALAGKLTRGHKAKESRAHFLKRAAGLSPAAIGLVREACGNALPDDPHALAALIKSTPVTFHAAQGLERAISSAGGIRFDALDDHFMLRTLPGIFAAGEMLDWEA